MIAPAGAGTVFMVIANVAEVPLVHPLVGVTVTLPAVAPAVTVIEFVVPPAVIVELAGNVQV